MSPGSPQNNQALWGAPRSSEMGSPTWPGSCRHLASWRWAGETPRMGDSFFKTFPGCPISSGLQLRTEIAQGKCSLFHAHSRNKHTDTNPVFVLCHLSYFFFFLKQPQAVLRFQTRAKKS